MTDDTDADGTDTTTDEPLSGRPGDDGGAETLSTLAARLRERAHPLATTDPGASTGDLRPLDDHLADATVVGLGEATHGTREFFRLKHRLVRYLVETHGCRVVAMESNFAATTAVDDYVVRGEGDAETAVSGLLKWPWKVDSVVALVEWLRAFNEGRPVEDRVRFYGVDAQQTAGPAEALRAYLERVDPALLDAHRDGLAMLADEGIDVEWTTEAFDAGATAAKAEQARELVDALTDRFEAREDEYVATTDRSAYDRHRWHLRLLDRAVAYRAASHDDMETAVRVRDEAMADTLSWVLDREDADQLALWAHDNHLRRRDRPTDWGMIPGTGAHLAERFGDDYYAVGFDFARGEFQALDAEYDGPDAHSLGPPPEGAVTHLLDAVGEDLLFVDLATATDDGALADWFDAERHKRDLGAVYYGEDATDEHHGVYRLPAEFDALLFVAETSRARPIEQVDDGEGEEG